MPPLCRGVVWWCFLLSACPVLFVWDFRLPVERIFLLNPFSPPLCHLDVLISNCLSLLAPEAPCSPGSCSSLSFPVHLLTSDAGLLAQNYSISMGSKLEPLQRESGKVWILNACHPLWWNSGRGSHLGNKSKLQLSDDTIHILDTIIVLLTIVPCSAVWLEHSHFSFLIKHSSGCGWSVQHFHCTSMSLGICGALSLYICGMPSQVSYSSCGLLAMNVPSITQVLNLPSPTSPSSQVTAASLLRRVPSVTGQQGIQGSEDPWTLGDLHISFGWVDECFFVVIFQLGILPLPLFPWTIKSS